ncbi:MAG: hypothetical protein ACR2H5_00875 [Ktedonobacteraceae bacterium]
MCEDEDGESEPRALPEVVSSGPGPCCVCKKSGRWRSCFRCGRPVCMDETNYMADTACGSWILDWWQESAFDEDDGNEYWCHACQEQEEKHRVEKTPHQWWEVRHE